MFSLSKNLNFCWISYFCWISSFNKRMIFIHGHLKTHPIKPEVNSNFILFRQTKSDETQIQKPDITYQNYLDGLNPNSNWEFLHQLRFLKYPKSAWKTRCGVWHCYHSPSFLLYNFLQCRYRPLNYEKLVQ